MYNSIFHIASVEQILSPDSTRSKKIIIVSDFY